ncbi:MAG: TetR/AcrR family transcriptional regulator [Myxococcota bacterium]
MRGRREQNKAQRRRAILDATAALLRERPFEQVTVDEIASLASVAPATVYNLVGTREQLLIGLIDRVIEDLIDTLAELATDGDDDPIAVARAVVDLSVEAFLADSTLYRRVIAGWSGGDLYLRKRATDPAQLQVAAMRQAQERGIIRPDLEPGALGQQIYVSFNGAFLLWVFGGLDDDGFRATARHGLIAVLLAGATPKHRSTFEAEMRALSPAVLRTLPPRG